MLRGERGETSTSMNMHLDAERSTPTGRRHIGLSTLNVCNLTETQGKRRPNEWMTIKEILNMSKGWHNRDFEDMLKGWPSGVKPVLKRVIEHQGERLPVYRTQRKRQCMWQRLVTCFGMWTDLEDTKLIEWFFAREATENKGDAGGSSGSGRKTLQQVSKKDRKKQITIV